MILRTHPMMMDLKAQGTWELNALIILRTSKRLTGWYDVAFREVMLVILHVSLTVW
jgi:hypothetical protein